MKRVLAVLITSIALLAGVGVSQAEAAINNPWRYDSRTVYVQSSLSPDKYPVKRAIEKLDNYSRLNLVLVHKCPSGKPCTRYFAGKLPNSVVGRSWSYVDGYTILHCKVQIDTKKMNRLPKIQRLGTLIHEAAHCLGFEHTNTKNDFMYHVNTKKRPWIPAKRYYDSLRRIYG